jgi:folate-binding protein YgfZ
MDNAIASILAQYPFPCTTQRDDIGVILLEGVDSAKFLQGQTTCDLKTLSVDQGLFGAICTLQGRVLCNFYLLQREDQIFMLLKADLLSKTLAHLQKFSVFFKTKLTDASDLWQVHSLFGRHNLTPTAAISTRAVHKNAQDHSVMEISLVPMSHFLVLAPRSQRLITDAVDLPLHLAQALESLAVQPWVDAHSSDQFLPQMLNMHITGGVSFKKGCYTGQEIVARMQYRGKLKKRLHLLHQMHNANPNLEPHALRTSNGEQVGEIVTCHYLEHTLWCLAVLSHDIATQALQFQQQPIETLPLPYPHPDEANPA